MLSNAYFLAKFRFDTAENEPAKNLQKFCKISRAGGPLGGQTRAALLYSETWIPEGSGTREVQHI